MIGLWLEVCWSFFFVSPAHLLAASTKIHLKAKTKACAPKYQNSVQQLQHVHFHQAILHLRPGHQVCSRLRRPLLRLHATTDIFSNGSNIILACIMVSFPLSAYLTQTDHFLARLSRRLHSVLHRRLQHRLVFLYPVAHISGGGVPRSSRCTARDAITEPFSKNASAPYSTNPKARCDVQGVVGLGTPPRLHATSFYHAANFRSRGGRVPIAGVICSLGFKRSTSFL